MLDWIKLILGALETSTNPVDKVAEVDDDEMLCLLYRKLAPRRDQTVGHNGDVTNPSAYELKAC